MKRALAILYASALVVAPLPTQALADASLKNCSRSAVDTFAKARLAQFKKGASFPGTTLAIFVPTRWSRPIAVVHGTTRPSASQPMRADVPMLAGSVGKTFFAAAALRLADERKLDLDRPIATYLPLANIPGAQQVTSRMLLSHTSGYGEYDGEFMETLIREPSRARALPDWIGPLQRNPPAAPGSYRYSDINFVLLGLVIDKASGEGAYRYIMRTMVRPYGLKSTFPADRIGLPGLAPGHAGAENFFGRDAMLDGGRLYYNPQFEFGGGGFVSSASDLARWIVLFSSATVVSPASWAQASRPVHVDAAKGRSYGLGIHIDRTPAGTAYGHSGYIPGYLSWVRWYPDVGISVAMQANASDEVRVPWDGYDLLDQLTVEIAAACK